MADVTSKKLQEYKDSLKTKAEDLILKGLPETIIKLNDILKTLPFHNGEFPDVHQDLSIPIPDPVVINSYTDLSPAKETKFDNSLPQDGTKVLILPSGSVPSNKYFTELLDLAKPLFRKLDEDSKLLKMWISIMIPKIDIGNSFEIIIQKYTLDEIRCGEIQAANFFNHISLYLIERGKLISKVVKYPHIDDYRRAIREIDEQELFRLWHAMLLLHNRYCLLHSIGVTNLDMIKMPCSTEFIQSLYY